MSLHSGGWADALRLDLRLALRSLARRPAFTILTVLTLGLGIGANVALFSVANLAFFQALPYPAADRIVLGQTRWPGGSIGNTVSAPDYYDVRDEAKAFSSLSAITPFSWDFTLTGSGAPLRLAGAWASPGLFHTLRVAPALGREFLPEEGEPGAARVVVISHHLWQSRFGGIPGILGTTMVLDGVPTIVVGVMPAGFAFVTEADLWLPMVRDEGFATARQFHNFLVVGRLRDGATLAQARSEVDLIMSRLARQYPDSNEGIGMELSELQSTVVAGLRPSLLMLLGAVALVLLIACGNVASLLLARGSGRRTELALRSALGAGRSRLVRQLLTESALLGLAAGGLGTLSGIALQRTLVAATPLTRVGVQGTTIQPAVLLFGLLLSVGTVLLFGLAPALASARVELARELRAGARSLTGVHTRFRNGLVVSQVALSLVMLVGAGLLLRSFTLLRRVDPGFDTTNLLTAAVSLPATKYGDLPRRIQFFNELQQQARILPGVQGVSLISRLPLRNGGGNVAAWDPAHPPASSAEARLAYDRVVVPGYFSTMRIPLRTGRDLAPTDDYGTTPVVVINEAMAHTLFPDQDPLGHLVAVDRGDSAISYQVVGTVGDVRLSGLTSPAPMVMYFPYAQRPTLNMRIAVRARGHPDALVAPLRRLLGELDADIPLADPRSMRAVLASTVSFTRTVTAALVLAAAIALFLAALGLYGVLAYHVAQRRQEIGVRVALGARTRDVVRMVLRQGFLLVAPGILLGAVGALGATRFVRGLLFDVRPTDPLTFAGVVAFLCLVALLACLVPAWRAGHVDPAVAFRAE